MKAQEGLKLYRTDGNTDPLLVILRAEIAEDTYTLVPDDATVELDILITGGTNIQIAGTAKGDSSGTFLFSVATIPAGASTLKFDLDVTTVSGKATYARGKIITKAKIE